MFQTTNQSMSSIIFFCFVHELSFASFILLHQFCLAETRQAENQPQLLMSKPRNLEPRKKADASTLLQVHRKTSRRNGLFLQQKNQRTAKSTGVHSVQYLKVPGTLRETTVFSHLALAENVVHTMVPGT